MKITTQRTFIWVANFALVGCMFTILAVMTKQTSRPTRNLQTKNVNDLAGAVKKILTSTRAAAASDGETVSEDIANILRNAFEGYIPPPPPDSRPRESLDPAAAPPLESLVDIVFVMAPEPGAKGGGRDDSVGVLLKVKSKPPEQSFFYRVGDTVGIDEIDFRTDRPRGDADPKLQQFKGAKVSRLDGIAVYFEWAGKESVVKMFSGEPEGIVIKRNNSSGEVLIGKSGGAAGAARPQANQDDGSDIGTFTAEANGVPDKFDISEKGLGFLTEKGDQIMEGVTFENVELPAPVGEDGQPVPNSAAGTGLKIRGLPSELQAKGLREGDVIIRVDDQNVSSKESIINYVKRTYRGKQQYIVTVLRDGAQRILTVNVPKTLKGQIDMRNRLQGTQGGQR